MPKSKTPLEQAAGKLISAVQKEWHTNLGEPGAGVSEEAMYRAHELLKAADPVSLCALLKDRSVADYLGVTWVKVHPAVLPAISALESALSEAKNTASR